MANVDMFPVTGLKSDEVIVTASLKGAGASAMVPQKDGSINSFISSCSRSSAGVFTLVFRHEFGKLLAAYPVARGATAGLKARFSAIDVKAKTATLHVETAADGTSAAYQTDVVVAANTATLGSAGVVTSVIATTETGTFPAWTTGVTVAANTATLATAGDVVAVHATTETGDPPQWLTSQSVTANAITLTGIIGMVVSVEATTADSAGAKSIKVSGSPGAGTCQVAYTAGVATITFNATDNVSVCAVQVYRPGMGIKGKEVISTGTPRVGQCTVTYGATGIATLTFAATDNVTAVSVLIKTKGELQKVKEIVSTGTPGVGQVKVTYSSGVPTLLFAAADNVTAVTVMQMPASDTAGAVDPGTTDYVDIVLVVRNSALN